ncbi:MAG: hypothetical protein HKN57_05180 [Xanthomonadales bacterium]|nr:hypothetical protein [Gammaproteobacteria bacterium]MBT8052617.1 hypothetical protein [Gammaproteobacteria bacterium]NND56624.1 hypothetical protein [Xanthomonadales bacterium]NNK52434.1 hypothetical protein [Xanthomonadales bacterium]
MNRKNLTCAVLAGLAGVAGLAATAQAVNLNPDGLGQVLVYPYYTANDGNQTVLSVVNTTNNAKAVKVRFLEGFNSREVLDFNLYMSEHDVWVASIAAGENAPTLFIPDSSCTVPYLYGMGKAAGLDYGMQPFLTLAYTGDNEDGGPTAIQRAAEGHFEMIEMGVLTGDSADDVRHDNSDGGTGEPADCMELSDKWSEVINGTNGIWFDEANFGTDDCTIDDQACTDTDRASGGLFGGAAVVNATNGTMYSYDAKAIQGFDKTDNGLHYEPGTIFPSLRSGSESDAWVFFGVPQNTAVQLDYSDEDDLSVDAVSAVFMHENLMNEYTTEDDLSAGTEWIITFPTKAFYADAALMVSLGIDEEACTGDGDDEVCVTTPRAPFTQLFGDESADGDRLCEVVSLKTWDREEKTFVPEGPGTGVIPPQVSPAPPRECITGLEPACTESTVFQLCNEVNVLRFGERSVFGTPDFGADGSLLLSVQDEFENGWGKINLGVDGDGDLRTDREGLVGLPVAGFAAYEFENDFVDNDGIKAFYGGLFGHKGNVRRVND